VLGAIGRGAFLIGQPAVSQSVKDGTSFGNLGESDSVWSTTVPAKDGWLVTGFRCTPRCRGTLLLQVVEARGNRILGMSHVPVDDSSSAFVVAFRPPRATGTEVKATTGEVRIFRAAKGTLEVVSSSRIDFQDGSFVSESAQRSAPSPGWTDAHCQNVSMRGLVGDGEYVDAGAWSWNGLHSDHDAVIKHWSNRRAGRISLLSKFAGTGLADWPDPVVLVLAAFMPESGSPYEYTYVR
jgi:hypothetical protein